MSRTALARLLVLALALAALVVLVAATDPRAVAVEITRLGWGGLLLFMLPSLVIQLLDVFGWWLCFPRPPAVSWTRLALIRLAGEAINNTLPVAQVGGEPVKVLLLRRHGVSAEEATASVVVAKLEVALAQFVFVLCGVAAALLARGPAELALGAAATGALGIAGVVAGIVVLNQGQGRTAARLVERLGLGAAFLARHGEALTRLDAALSGVYGGAGRRVLSISAFLAAWFVETLEVGIFAAVLGLTLGPLEALAIASLVTVVRAAGSFSPASLGVHEGGAALLFKAFGETEALGLAYAIVRRVRDLPWLAVGAATLGSYGMRSPEVR